MKNRLFFLAPALVLIGCIDNANKKSSVFERSFKNKSELLASGFTQAFTVFESFGKKQKVMMEHLYYNGVGDTTLLCGLNDDNSVKLITIVLPLNKSDTIALYSFLHKIGFEKEYRQGQKPTLFITNNKEKIEYNVNKGKYEIHFNRWLDTSKHPFNYPVHMDTAFTISPQRK